MISIDTAHMYAVSRASTLLAALIFGCASGAQQMYSGPALSRDQAVTLRRTATSRVFEIDGTKVEGWAWEIQPGSHELVVSVMGQTMIQGSSIVIWSSCAVRFVADPGGTYRIVGRSVDNTDTQYFYIAKIYADVVDVETGELSSCLAHDASFARPREPEAQEGEGLLDSH